jgi:hypothetical protein
MSAQLAKNASRLQLLWQTCTSAQARTPWIRHSIQVPRLPNTVIALSRDPRGLRSPSYILQDHLMSHCSDECALYPIDFTPWRKMEIGQSVVIYRWPSIDLFFGRFSGFTFQDEWRVQLAASKTWTLTNHESAPSRFQAATQHLNSSVV